MTNKWEFNKALKRVLDAKRKAEADMWAVIGDDPTTENNPYQAEADLDQSNTVYARLHDGLEPITVRYDPASDPRLRQWGTPVTLEYDGEYWITGPYKRRLTAQQDGLDLPTGGLPLREHDHTSADEGGTLGADTVSATQIVAGSITGTEIASATIQNSNMAANSIDSDQYVDGSIDNVHLANDSVKVTNLNNLTASTNGYVRQNTSDQFITEKLAFVNGTSPTTSDDSTQGYLSFSKWMDWANERLFMAFSVFPSSATWKRFLFSGEVVPTDTDALTGSSAAIVAQTASDTFTSIPYTLTDNRTLHYDGSTIRRRFVLATNTGGTVTTSLAASALVYITNNLGSDVDVTGSLIKCTFTLSFRGDTVGDVYDLSVQYNYNNGGVESWVTFPSVTANTPFTETIFTANYIATRTYVAFFDFASVATAWGFGGNYYIRLIAARQSGTGALTVFSSGTRARTAIIEEM